jgi:endonuclease/exonuclease/phosphatase family metal-dependent hydrolase
VSNLRLLTYNVRSLRDDPVAAGAVIRACEPDVVCVQEVPRFLRWRSKRAELARRAGLVVATAHRAGGLALLVAPRVKLIDQAFHPLSKRPKLHQRVLDTAVVEVDGARWRVGSLHLSLDGDERMHHLDEMFEWLTVTQPAEDVPLVLAGDINETPGKAVWGRLAERFTDAYVAAPAGEGDTYSTLRPHKRIDGIFAGHEVDVRSCSVPDVPGIAQASDHRPVLAELSIA